jgi:hypothetical protein
VEAEAVGVAAAISDADGISGGRVDGDDGESDDDDDDAANDDEEGDDDESVAFVEGGGGERMAGSPGGEGGSVMELVVAVAVIDDETAASPPCCSMPTLEDDEVDWSIISALFGKLESNPQEWRWMGSPTPITATSMNYCLILGVGGGTKAEGED